MRPITDLNVKELRRGIRAWSAGSYPLEAAAELLIRHDHWLRRRDFLERCALMSAGRAYVTILWDIVPEVTDDLPHNRTNRAIALIAGELAGHPAPHSLGHTLTGLDRANLDLVLAAISHAGGTHHNVEHLGAPGDGTPATVTSTSVRIRLGPLHPWPR